MIATMYDGAFRLGEFVNMKVGDIIKENGKLTNTGEKRTGCMFCMFGVHLEKGGNRFQRMARTHPSQYKYCMEKLGLKNILDYLKIEYMPRDEKLNEWWN